LDNIAENLVVRFEVVDNFYAVEKFKAKISLTNSGESPITKVKLNRNKFKEGSNMTLLVDFNPTP